MSALIVQISAGLEQGGVRPDIAYVQARDIASLLACGKFLSAYEPLVTPDTTGAQAPHQQAIAVRIIHGAVFIHTTATFKDNAAPNQDPPRLTQVVDLEVKLRSMPGRSRSVGRLEAEVTKATVQLARSSRHDALIAETKRRLGVPAAASSRWERLTRALSKLFGDRGIRFVAGNVNDLTDPALLARPAGIGLSLEGIEDPSWFVCAEQAYGHRRHAVASYRSDEDGYAYVVRRNGTEVEAETQRAVTDLCARILAADRATLLRLDTYANIGEPRSFCGVPELADRTSPRATPLHPYAYGRGNEHVRELAELGAQNDAMLLDAVCTALNGALFPAPGTHRLVIEVDGEDIVDQHLLKACEALSNLEQLALARPQELAPSLAAWVTDSGLPGPWPDELNMAAVKRAVVGSVIERIKQALPDDVALRRQVLATLAGADVAMHRVCQTHGLPTFENELERRQITLSARRTNPRLLDGPVDIAFNSWQHTLSPNGRVCFGDEPNNVFPAHMLSTAMLLAKASFRVTNEHSRLTSVQYEAQLALVVARNNAAQPGQ
ncbi:hypothetical protein AB870_24675 (plasmid) [Pandoraea faecigallinarum]|uniref:Uncharacterized protein n=1 Tax=Pandoraea faecigallinarum TaxID=656179 RepID=A0A0H3WZ24_9BURK|nr:hypothetical protein [Pandoraea faecigallinarum]AKM33379.1 hypothetical protein AB870_24675 [Pandoraea faecigallinarum]